MKIKLLIAALGLAALPALANDYSQNKHHWHKGHWLKERKGYTYVAPRWAAAGRASGALAGPHRFEMGGRLRG